MSQVICTTVDEDLSFNLFSRARYLILVRDGVIIHREINPALSSVSKRPMVASRCVELGADVVIAPHGSLCFPSYQILRKAGVGIYAINVGERLNVDLTRASKHVDLGEVIYSSFLAVKERIMEAVFHEQ
ncbi:hypothetical protein [Vulcanisaeta souniana]|uniref:Dinitrogenase iron-molybdenum cofactor biosynthesis domain-containing protein n=1 Tax=Vulcanisaeta souniana JCM 11219 TaxID=1293586 RepID=A0A830E096_9CREN|nr:hypothetical protein [Vulcanisaeta souniana]BDR91564.1 hypothetical protein Vsou_06570 [Vulcanisaeta souniana JCM 11219]GGI74176.1 hypothetical protein GCM10007112_08730 [Vulcanisaeta souniana JCM 11219]